MNDAAEIKADIELTRAELARTVDALRTKLDIKSRAKHHLQESATNACAAAEQKERALLTGGSFPLARRLRRTRGLTSGG